MKFLDSLTRWYEVCQNMPYAIQEVLYAWEHKVLTHEEVMVIYILFKSWQPGDCCVFFKKCNIHREFSRYNTIFYSTWQISLKMAILYF